MPTFTDARQAIEVLKTHLSTKLAAAPYVSQFTTFGGADVIVADEETEPMQVGKPYIRLEPAGSEDATETWGRGAWRVRVTATVIATGSSGAIVGAANATASDTLLSRALKTIIRDGFHELCAAGVLDCKVTDPRETNTDNETGLTHNNQHEISFVYFDE